jgi:hypothetical protein
MLENYQPSQTALLPIVRNPPNVILSLYNKNSNSLYNNLSPYTEYGSIGPRQPFVYIKPNDSTFSRNLTKYDNQAFPIGSTARDLNRVGQYLITGNGILFTGKQLLLQQQNSFNETRIYNPLSVLKATTKPGSLGLIDYPQRHLETSGGILNFFKDALLSTVGIQTKDAEKPRIDGTAQGVNGIAYSTYAQKLGGARAGLLRYNTADRAATSFDTRWASNGEKESGSGKFLTNLGNALKSKLKSLIPSTNPMGAFGGSTGTSWKFRPEYQVNKNGIYYVFLSDTAGFMYENRAASPDFYNDNFLDIGRSESNLKKLNDVGVGTYHKYFPTKPYPDNTNGSVGESYYASKQQIIANATTEFTKTKNLGPKSIGAPIDVDGYQNNLIDRYRKMLNSFSKEDDIAQFKKSAERNLTVTATSPSGEKRQYPSYEKIPNKGDDKFEIKQQKNIITVDKMGFAKAVKFNPDTGLPIIERYHDEYNALYANDERLIKQKRNNVPDLLKIKDTDQSKDVIFFYFFDLINEVYIPFRATLSGVSDQHSADWEDITYLGRADRLFLYKGFSRDVNISFTVYANSAKELIPMWTRINYLVGLVRPSKYTGVAVATSGIESIGTESSFIYPPMITIRVGDLFVDQPCVISSIGTTIPDDANWESYRTNNDYKYSYDAAKAPIKVATKTRQLPTKVDISLTLKMLEKERSEGFKDHYGFNMDDLSKG